MEALPVPDASAARAAARAEKNRKAIECGVNWFYWIGGLSLINSALLLFKINVVFFVGLGVTLIFEGLGFMGREKVPDAAVIVRGSVVTIDLAVAALFFYFGHLARRGRDWAFVVGMVLYAADSLLVMMLQNWIGLGFHALALAGISSGYAALRRERADLALAAVPAALPALAAEEARAVREHEPV